MERVPDRASRYQRLVVTSRERFYNAFEAFVWPESLPRDRYWLSPGLLSVAGTPWEERLTGEQRLALSRTESVNFYSLSMYGERDLCQVVLDHIHTGAYGGESEYFHHFLEEENKHMWFFSQFCLRYAGKLYPNRAVKFASFEAPDIQSFVAFAKIMIFEEIGDYYNVKLLGDEELPDVVRLLNRLHHQDESRHLAMGRFVLARLHRELRDAHGSDAVVAIEAYLKRYMRASLVSFYNPSAYADAGIEQPYELRRALSDHPARRELHREVVRRVSRFLVDEAIFQTEDLYDVPLAG